MFIKNGLLSPVRYCPSPNCDARPDPTDISLLVIHSISLPPGEFGSSCVEDFFCNRLDIQQHPYFLTIADLRVSSHVLITRAGKLCQFVPFEKRAWHAGESSFAGRTACNDFSIGIELEGTDDLPFTAVQYELLAQVTQLLLQQYPLLVPNRIVGHADIAPQRKTDPGSGFDWSLYKSLITKQIKHKPHPNSQAS